MVPMRSRLWDENQELGLDAMLGAPELRHWIDLMGRTLGAAWRDVLGREASLEQPKTKSQKIWQTSICGYKMMIS